MSPSAPRAENAEVDRLYREANGQLARARGLLALAHRHASKLPPTSEDQEKSRTALAEAIGLCVTATHYAKAHNLYKITDSGLNPSQIRRSVQLGLSKSGNSGGPATRQRPQPPAPSPDRLSLPLFAQLDACRRMNLEGLCCLAESENQPQGTWRGTQLLKIAEQLCVITALECKLLGLYVLGDPAKEPAAVRQTIGDWATAATRKDLEEE